MNDKEKVSLLFTGGWDSTLAAFRLCETFKRVHLLTYYHSRSDFTSHSRVNVNKLKDRFGDAKIVHEIIDIDQLKEKLWHGTWRQDKKKYGLFLINCECSACRIAMFARGIIYNLENNVPYLTSGEVETAPFHIGKKGISEKLDELKRGLCNNFGITYIRPVFYEKEPHKRLFELGFIDKEVEYTKFPYEYLFHKTQPTCYICPFSFMFNKFYYLPYHGKKAYEEKKLKYFTEKLEVARELIKDYLIKNDKNYK
jgi:tRNA U34 2-thiouridine synthase MnmA/TrmU